MKKNTRWYKVALVVGFLLVTALVAVRYSVAQANELRAKVTATHMNYLADVLAEELPGRTDRDTIKTILSERGQQKILYDGWGNPLVVEHRMLPNETAGWRIIAVGRDGARGGCCTRWVHGRFEEDAVLEVNPGGEDRWVQLW